MLPGAFERMDAFSAMVFNIACMVEGNLTIIFISGKEMTEVSIIPHANL